jgi:sugar phosphate isomerase/epimerase
VKLGVLTVVLHDVPFEAALDRLAELGVEAIELGTGNHPGDAHCPADVLLARPEKAAALRAAVESRGMIISALSCHGNPLHPDAAAAASVQRVWERTLELAELLEVGIVNTFSGCPGDHADARHPNWVTCAWPPEYLDVLDWQWQERAIPYWIEERDRAKRHGITKIALEMHPGFVVYNPETLLRLRKAVGPEIGANLDPSHLFWQGIDAIAAAKSLTARDAVFHVHAKDTYLDPAVIRANGVLDTKPYDRIRERAWTFRSVGYGHGERFWRDFVSVLRAGGYDFVLSIEHEDLLASRDEGLARAVQLLDRVILREPPVAPWWT